MRSLYLIGFRGSGKTTLGKLLAERKRWGFLDLDARFEEVNGQTILEFVSRRGLEAFRAAEEKLLRETDWALSQKDASPHVVATGGGFVDWEPSRMLLSASSLPRLYLEVDAESLWQRLENSPERKKIGDLTDLGALRSLLEKRRPHFEKIATFRLPNRDISVALSAIEGQWEKLWTATPFPPSGAR